MAHGFRGILQGQAKNLVKYLLALCDISLHFVDLYRIVLLRTLRRGEEALDCQSEPAVTSRLVCLL